MDYHAGAEEYDSIVVNDITVDPRGGEGSWCRCEKLTDTTLRYYAVTENPSSSPRYALFKHKTTDTVLAGGEHEGRPVLKEWWVTVMQEGNPGTSQPSEPEPETPVQPDPETPVQPEIPTEPEQDGNIGSYLYSVGILSDLHICVDNDDNTLDTDDNWWDEGDFTRAMDLFKSDNNIKFIASCGDTIDSGSPKQGTPEDDSKEFVNIYDAPYWQIAGLRYFAPLGNHDFYGIFESRQGDTVRGDEYPNSECLAGYNVSRSLAEIQNNIGVSGRVDNIFVSGSGVNGVNPRARMFFDEVNDHIIYNRDGQPYGQGDINFFEYNGYMGLYKDQAGWSGSMLDSDNDYRFLPAAKATMKNYVNNNWNACKDNLSAWDQPHSRDCGYRNRYSKLNYWLKKGNDIFVFMSVDYGNDIWPITNDWHDRMIHARTIIDVTSDDPYIRRMVDYVSDTDYSNDDVPYNYQYYSPNTLIWLKEIIENNPTKKIYVFAHHFLPHKAGNSTGIPKTGWYKYSEITKAGILDSDNEAPSIQYNVGSNALSGIEFWFLNKLNNLYKNVIFFSGHSHISWENNNHFVNHDYEIVSPAYQNEYVYTQDNNTPQSTSGYTVALPSLSKPRFIDNTGNTNRRYNDAEYTIMEVYEKGVKIKGYKIKQNNQNVNNLLVEKTIKLIN